MKQVINCVGDKINFINEPNRFQILGSDFLTNTDLEPFLLEINDCAVLSETATVGTDRNTLGTGSSKSQVAVATGRDAS